MILFSYNFSLKTHLPTKIKSLLDALTENMPPTVEKLKVLWTYTTVLQIDIEALMPCYEGRMKCRFPSLRCVWISGYVATFFWKRGQRGADTLILESGVFYYVFYLSNNFWFADISYHRHESADVIRSMSKRDLRYYPVWIFLHSIFVYCGP